MAFNFDHVSRKILCVGMSGSGKTQKAMRFVKESNYAYYFVFDHDGQFAARSGLKGAFTPDGLTAQLKHSGFVVFNPSEMFGDMRGDANMRKRAGAFDWFAGYAFRVAEKLPQDRDGAKLLYADEVQDICTVSKIGIHAQQAITSGRNRSLDFVGAGVQYNLIHHSVRAGASEVYAFRTIEANALADLAAIGFDPRELSTQPLGSYVMRNARGEEARGKVF